MTSPALLPNLFRNEFGKITSVLVKHFGLQHVEVAEDIASETFLLAMETWPYRGVPENPTAWLYAVAKNKTKNVLQRSRTLDEKIKAEWVQSQEHLTEPDIDLSNQNILDSQLRMLFALCHPGIPVESQVALCLRILCGFGIDELASAFLVNKETINKRLVRAREKLRTTEVTLEFPAEEQLVPRLDNVLTTLYLMFSEGYYSETNETIIREDLCEEAIRSVKLLTSNEKTNTPAAHALLALMYFHASRLKARTSPTGELVLYDDQDERLWSQEYISRGAYYLSLSAKGTTLTKYHLEASIAYWHTIRTDTREKWENILQLYNRLLQLEYSPIAALNRTYALAKANGVEEAIAEAEKLKLTTNQYYHTLLGELHRGTDDKLSRAYLQQAQRLSKSSAERNAIQKKIDSLKD
ncbi:MAG TPA: sigma-70 family RNA polymerase sigma factor [Chryseosolibacter sp.]